MDVELPWFSSLQGRTVETRLTLWYISTSVLCDGLFLAEQILEWRVNYMYMQSTSNSTRWGCHLPSDQFYECFQWPRCTEPKWGFSPKNAYQSDTYLVHFIQGFWIGVNAPHASLLQRFVPLFLHIYGHNTRRCKPCSSKPVFRTQHRKQSSQRQGACALCCEKWVKYWAKKPVWHQKRVNSMRAIETAAP